MNDKKAPQTGETENQRTGHGDVVPRAFHPVADIFPLLDGPGFEELVDDVRAHGLHEPIWLHPDGRVVDGRNRARACAIAGVTPTYRTWDGDGSLIAFVVSLNLRRRHLADEGCAATYAFTGFLPPVDNPPTLNTAKAGSAIPIKFSLGGNQGLDIFATGSPVSGAMPCDAAEPLDAIESTVAAGSSGLSYDATAGRYVYVWKTEKAWAGQCRQLNVRLNDGSSHVANFKFMK